jgi:SSS family solute:Na+ symporter
MDIHKELIRKNASEKELVTVGRIVSVISVIVAAVIAPLLGALDQAFQYIQEYTGFISPGIVAIFIFGLFWKKATANSALWAAVITIPLSAAFKYFTPDLPFMDRMGVVFLIDAAIIVVISLIENKGDSPKAIKISKKLFETGTVFNVASIGICTILAVLYILFW